MRVAVILPRIDQLGPVKVIQNLVNSLDFSENIFVKVFYIDKDVDQSLRMSVPVERLDRRNFPFSDFDIIHTNGIRPDLWAFLNRNKIRYHISTIHNFVFEDLRFTYNNLISFLFGNLWLTLWKRADKLVCPSEAMKSYYSKWLPETEIVVIYNGIAESDSLALPDNDVITAIEGFRSKGLRIIGNAAILTKIKGIEQILNLLSEDEDLALVLIGKGKELKTLKRKAKKMKISERCFFCGFRRDAVKYFKFFDHILVPSLSEGFGLVLTEAVQQKVPVICSDLMVFNELFRKEEVTFFKYGDLSSLFDALTTSINEGTKKAELAYTRYHNYYTALTMANSYYELYKSA
jgi:glycosyltransferase involved in cell wall biosynthesis